VRIGKILFMTLARESLSVGDVKLTAICPQEGATAARALLAEVSSFASTPKGLRDGGAERAEVARRREGCTRGSIWKGVRRPELEAKVIGESARRAAIDRWSAFLDFDSMFEMIADGGAERLERSCVSSLGGTPEDKQ
jgi:hypothetical protein